VRHVPRERWILAGAAEHSGEHVGGEEDIGRPQLTDRRDASTGVARAREQAGEAACPIRLVGLGER